MTGAKVIETDRLTVALEKIRKLAQETGFGENVRLWQKRLKEIETVADDAVKWIEKRKANRL